MKVLSNETREKIIQHKSNGETVKNIEHSLLISERYVYTI